MLALSNEEAELVREQLGDLLAVADFDENYEPNQKGSSLEKLIDLLFMP